MKMPAKSSATSLIGSQSNLLAARRSSGVKASESPTMMMKAPSRSSAVTGSWVPKITTSPRSTEADSRIVAMIAAISRKLMPPSTCTGAPSGVGSRGMWPSLR